MAAAGARVVGIDFSPGMLAKLRAKPGADAVRLVRHDLATGLPLASGSMDRVTCCLVLEHVADLASGFVEMSRICRAGGFVLVSDLHPAMRWWERGPSSPIQRQAARPGPPARDTSAPTT
jgi:ubiquinone/menaquinone biosynthesis C-methylase UbiE